MELRKQKTKKIPGRSAPDRCYEITVYFKTNRDTGPYDVAPTSFDDVTTYTITDKILTIYYAREDTGIQSTVMLVLDNIYYIEITPIYEDDEKEY